MTPADSMRVADVVVARLAARAALAVPGVVALQADLSQAMLGLAGTVLAQRRRGKPGWTAPPSGVTATVREGREGQLGVVDVRLTLVSRLGHNCRELAKLVQQRVRADVFELTGLRPVVSVTIAEVMLE